MKLDPGIFLYLIFLAAILVSAFLKNRRRPRTAEVPTEYFQASANFPTPDSSQLSAWGRSAAPMAPSVRRTDTVQKTVSVVPRRNGARARFRDRNDLRQAVVARLVIGLPKSLETPK
jgi:hypothetical protein